KAGGQELEHWQQESAPVILKRLLVASMAAAVVWRLQRNTSPEAEELKKVLTQLSGKSRKPPTASILLSGLFVLLQILDYLDSIGGDDLNQITKLRSLLKKCLPNNV
ncbi:MAG: IS4 family transposase, partial [Planctomycetaceae bacterium]|nr:IS4 family transposase [Planctomycetaceae bacterium]